ncbi:elongator complex protein-like protein 1 [Amylocarpus encephaloides]|uniref:Elongator complex protein 1 n=1 Tax=Amylocarpus encephaloides TaxID=45428 RepID=A0A9P8C0P2_9HELO|nr:elongator complex protein-like protein 1 [Amylocarpus encephaloides]
MRNLRNIRYEPWTPPSQFHGRPVTAATWDLATDSGICAFGPSEDSSVIELVRVQTDPTLLECTRITAWDTPCPNPQLTCDKILRLHYFGDSQTVCLVLAGGDIVVVREEPMPGEDRIEIVGSVDAGITSAKWSPDEELLAITTLANTVVFMSRTFEGITDISMAEDDLKASNHVSVGWGKKETQFQGKGAKALKDPTMPDKIDEGVLSPNDDSRTTITWRGDGAYLAISTIEGGTRRLIRVYSREGVLDSVSEPVDGLEGALSWRPSGNLIASIQRLEERVDVVFFERNGLRHGQFSLRLSAEELHSPDQHITLSWNEDSTVLAVILADSIQLWTMGNYHWYLKQEIRTIHAVSPSTSPLVWHSEKPLRFLTIDSNHIISFEYIFSVARGPICPPRDYSVVGVIDGQTINVTPLRTANVPPPMALHELKVHSNAVDIAFSADSSLLAVLHLDGIALFEWSASESASSPPLLTGRVTFDKPKSPDDMCQQITFTDKNHLLVLQPVGSTEEPVKRYGFNKDTGRMDQVPSGINTNAIIRTMSGFSQDSSTHPFVQTGSGELHSLAFGDHTLAHCKFPVYLPWTEIILQGDEFMAFGMSSNGHLYANSRLLVKNCTSFLITPAHLIFTTTAHLIKFVHITNATDLEIPPDDPEKDERCRSIERGARLITAMPSVLSLVLQMPRGNLETIYPRAMVLAGIRNLIDEKNYRKAFTHCRTQRVDMNLLHDHAPEQFLSNIDLFIDQVKKISYIDLFLSSLREEDVTQVMYKETRVMIDPGTRTVGVNGANALSPAQTFVQNISKVNRVCDAFLEVLEMRGTTNLQNIITANVCKFPPALEDGLQVVAQLMKEEEAMADKAVEHICFLADVNRLYDSALGLYNLDLALLVAQQSQKDPREYLPFMQKLQEMTELRRRFGIDDHLSRHEKALTQLHALDAFRELQTYTQKHALYQAALSLYRYTPARHGILTELYARYLESQSSFKEAALAYESLNLFSQATSCYLSSGPAQWRETLSCALSQTPQLSSSALEDLSTTLTEALTESKDHHAAAQIHLDYLSSLPNALRSYCRGYFFADALHLIARKRMPELLEEVIDPGLTDALASSTELLAECKAQLLAQVPRIRELRLKALADPLAFYEGERGGDGEIPDDVSVAASSRILTNRSLFTRYTGKQSIGTAGTGVSRATSKNRRREERKRARGKKGSVYEEEYLVASVGRLITRIESVREEITRLVEGLVRRGMWERARAIEVAMAEVVGMCKECVDAVFGVGEKEKGKGVIGERGEWKPVGGDAVLTDSILERGRRKDVPFVGAFERLSLLGL